MNINVRLSHEEREVLIGRLAQARQLQKLAIERSNRGISREASSPFSDSYVRNAPTEKDRFDEN